MSRIYFHTPSGEAEVSGSERAHFGILTDEVGKGLLFGILGHDELFAALNPHHPAHAALAGGSWVGWKERVGLHIGGMFSHDRPAFLHQGNPVDHWTVMLNTILQEGGDGLRLAVRIHAQCEMHCYAEGTDRVWLAGIIQGARNSGLFRAGMGWEQVIDLLVSRDDEPVVLSYSVCDDFPNRYSTTWEPPNRGRDFDTDEEEAAAEEADDEAWYELPGAEKWRHGMEWLRTHGPRLQPGEWGTYRFTHRLTVHDLLHQPKDIAA